ncbi:MarR family transcriptional regulator [Paraglaciecola aquimarina]|uniref:MarR family transcriptional regulator n=1 Tax=Paraglaciecola algarum TaxID=3050085 RepID=A0ABS9D956_9ALTE|nr:MarR family transcriptional regulator [Paraglaciecola sp. G1-23]MCF2949454.1 MarR family transcriptional regulator [Paraglaciecola sp. G1-23]
MNLNEALFSLMHSVRSTMLLRLKQLDKNLSPMHMKSLKVISKLEESTGQQLADFLGRDKAQINRLIKELVKQKMVTKIDNPKDKRSQLLTLTESGHELVKRFNKVEKELFDIMALNIEPEDLQAFIQLSQKLKVNLESI